MEREYKLLNKRKLCISKDWKVKMSPIKNKVYIIANPKAGSMNIDQFTQMLSGIFKESNVAYQLHWTHPNENLSSILQPALEGDYDLVAAAGGDGTVSQVADALHGTGVPLGILPLGTGNVLVKELGIPDDLDKAVRLLLNKHQLCYIDGLKIGEHIYLLDIGTGISSLMMDRTQQEAKRRLGMIAYLWEGTKRLVGLQPTRYNLEIDSHKLSVVAAEVNITNIRIAGIKPFYWGEDIAVDDHHVNVCIVRGKSLLDYLLTLFDLLTGKAERSRHIRCYKSRSQIYIDSPASLAVQADGEIIGETPLKIEVIPRAISIIVPPATGDRN